MKIIFVSFAFSFCFSQVGFSQKKDTILIDASKVDPSVLKTGLNRYLVYFQNGKDSSRGKYQLWSRKTEIVNYKGQQAISVSQEWVDNDTVTHKAYSVCDRKTFLPFYHESWWRSRGAASFDFLDKTAMLQGSPLTDADTARLKQNMYAAFKKSLGQYFLNWHLDLEVFSILPYKENATFLINFYDPGFQEPKQQAYTVVGSASLTGYNDQVIDCWLLSHGSTNNKEVFWISKKTKEVLKLEQEFNGRYRYKIKLGFSA